MGTGIKNENISMLSHYALTGVTDDQPSFRLIIASNEMLCSGNRLNKHTIKEFASNLISNPVKPALFDRMKAAILAGKKRKPRSSRLSPINSPGL